MLLGREEQNELHDGVSEPEPSGGDALLRCLPEVGPKALDSLPGLALIVCSEIIVASNALARRLSGHGDVPTGWGKLQNLLIASDFEGPGRFPDLSADRTRFEALLMRSQGLPLEVSVASQPIVYEGKPAVLLIMLEHRTQRLLADRTDRSFLEDLLEGAPGASVVTQDGKVLHVNSEFGRMFGYSQAETVGRALNDLVLPEGRMHEIEMFEHVLDQQGRATLDTERRTRTGERLEVQVMISRLRMGGEARGLFISYRDIREQKKEEARLLHTALHDALTGLPNRRLFVHRAELMLARLRRRPNRGFAIFFLDLDGFKKVNDDLGHAAGDALLLTMAERLKACLRPQDTVARFGGDEFALLLDEAGTEVELEHLAQRLQIEIGQTFEWMGHNAVVGASIGIAKAGIRQTAEEMLRAADMAMYVAKNNGKRQFAMAFDRI